MKTWKIGVIGCGNIAETVYLPQLRKLNNARVTAVCDISPERAEQVAREFDVPAWYTDVDLFLAQADVEIVMSVAAIQGRDETNLKALRAGKHLYSQKPFASSVEAATLQIEEAKKRNLILSTAPVHRNRPEIRHVKQLLDDGVIGHPSLMRIDVSHGGPEYYQFRDTDPSWFYRPGAGALPDIGVHGVDQVVAMLGPATRVSCMATISEPRRMIRSGRLDGQEIITDQIPDNYIITLDFGNGTLGLVTSGFIQKASADPLSGGGFEIYGNRGTISVAGGIAYTDTAEVKVFLDRPEKGLRGWMQAQQIPRTPHDEYFQALCIADLIQAAEENHPSRLSPEHSRHVIEILAAIPVSLAEGRTVELHTTF